MAQEPSTDGTSLIKQYMFDPKNLKYLLIGSIVFNLLLLCATVALLSQRGNSPATEQVGPTALPSSKPSPSITPRATIPPTQTPDEQTQALNECFANCSERDFLDQLEKELSKVKHFKATLSHNNIESKSCYGQNITASAPNAEYQSYFRPSDCQNNFNYVAQTDRFLLGEKIYFYNTNTKKWETGSVSPRIRIRMFDILENVSKQQSLSSRFEQLDGRNFRIVSGVSKSVNEFNQVINKTVEIKVGADYVIYGYSHVEDTSFEEYGSFFDINVVNGIEAPL